MPDLPKRTLGRTGLNVTALGYGALELRGMVGGVGRPLTSGQPKRILNAVLDAGINYIDVAVDYGEAESHLGRCIANRRKEFFLASKCGCPLDVRKFSPSERTRFGVPLPRLHDYSRDNIINACEQSLRRLKTDYLDVIQFHFSPAREILEQEGAVQTLEELKREGKIRFIGCSSILPNIIDHIEMGVFDVLQVPYSALQPEHETAIAAAAEAGMQDEINPQTQTRVSWSNTPDVAGAYLDQLKRADAIDAALAGQVSAVIDGWRAGRIDAVAAAAAVASLTASSEVQGVAPLAAGRMKALAGVLASAAG